MNSYTGGGRTVGALCVAGRTRHSGGPSGDPDAGTLGDAGHVDYAPNAFGDCSDGCPDNRPIPDKADRDRVR